MNPRIIEQLEALYATLPTVQCQRKCQACCGPILIPKIEAQRLEEKRGFLQLITGIEGAKRAYLPAPEIIEREFVGLKPEPFQDYAGATSSLSCIFLAPIVGSCMAYSIRPLVCRVWGTMDNEFMRCPFGCVPTPRWLTMEEHKELILKVVAIQKGET